MKNSSKRLESLQKKIDLGTLVIEDPVTIFYLLGLRLSLGQLLVARDFAALFVDGRYTQACQEKSPCPVYGRDAFAEMAKKQSPLIFDQNRASYAQYEVLKRFGVPLEAQPSLVDTMRWVKDDAEIAATKKSVALLTRGYHYILSILRDGITEEEVGRAFHIEMLRQGAEALSFEPIIAFGANSAKPHYRGGDKRLEKGEPVLIDIGVVVDDYCSDMTRTHVRDCQDARYHKLYEVTRAAAAAAIAECQVGTPFGKLDEKARAVMRDHGLEKYFLHTLGHGIGLEVHEGFRIRYDAPGSEIKLVPGMIFTIEPGLYIEGLGGVRHEEMILIQESGPLVLTPQES